MGGIVWPIMLNELRKLTSFANAVRATAAVTGLLLLIANFIMKTQSSQRSDLAKTDFKIIRVFKDEAYLVSIVAAFCIGLGLFFPCLFLLLQK
jgi:hypothetical protein